MTIDITSKMFILLAAYTLLHAAVYIWYQSKKQGNAGAGDSSENNGYGAAHRRRVGSGIHRSRSRHRKFLIAAMLLTALLLAGLVMVSGSP